jgi:hypothetical protein
MAAYRDLGAWAAAAEWLNVHGFAAAVPVPLASVLASRGLVVWGVSGRAAA